jgi:hypothetical protein
MISISSIGSYQTKRLNSRHAWDQFNELNDFGHVDQFRSDESVPIVQEVPSDD